MKLWIVGKRVAPDKLPIWEFIGVFSTEDLAVQACTGSTFFVGPAILDVINSPDLTIPWPGAYYPRK